MDPIWLAAELYREWDRQTRADEAGPFSEAAYEANAAAGARWEAQQAVRRGLRQVEAGQPDEALHTLTAAAARLPEGPERQQVLALANRLREAVAGGPSTTAL